MIIKKSKKQNKGNVDKEVQPQQQEQVVAETSPAEENEIDLFDLDNINFKQRQERRKGDRRRGFRRVDDRNLISRAKEEAQAIREAASKEGYDEGLELAKADIENLRQSMDAFLGAKQKIYDMIAPDVLEISFDIAKKIIKKEVSQDSEIILNNIKDILGNLSKDESKIMIKVNPQQAALLEERVPKLVESEGIEAKVVILADEQVMEGGCLVTTTNGVIDATIETQLEIITEALKVV